MLPLRDINRTKKLPIVTILLIIINSAVWIYSVTLGAGFESFIREFGLVPKNIINNPITILTHMFLHGNWFHIISNMWVLWIFGDNVEDAMGKLRFIIFYLLCGLGAAALQVGIGFIFGSSEIPMVGASGAISGLLGAYMKFFPGARILSLVFFFFFVSFAQIPAIIFIGFWFISQVINGILTLPFAGIGGVAWWAHIGGFLTGIYLCKKFRIYTRRKKVLIVKYH